MATGGWGRSSVPLTLILLLGCGCAPDTVQVKTTPYFTPDQVGTVALVPFDVLTTPQGASYPPRSITPPSLRSIAGITIIRSPYKAGTPSGSTFSLSYNQGSGAGECYIP